MKNKVRSSSSEGSIHRWQQNFSSFLALFTSTGTLICCAIPSVVVAIAGGSALVSLISSFPWLVTLSQYSHWIFIIAGVMIAFSGILIYRPGGKVACSITGGKGCHIAGRFQKVLFWISAVFYTIGLFAAYGLLPLLELLQ